MAWTIEVDTGAGFVAHEYLRFNFEKSLNQIESAYAQLVPESTELNEGDEVKITWDKSGGDKRVWFRGLVVRKRKDDLRDVIEVWCYDDSFDFYKSSLGDFRDYGSATPHSIVTSAGSPKGLIYNAQGNAIMAYATTAPNAITGGAPGNALTFRAHTSRNILHLGRLCEQATHGGGPTYGLEWFVDRSGADAKQLNVVTRREHAAVYTAESFQIGVDLHIVPRSTDEDNKYDRVLVVGSGSGRARVTSSWVGAGTRELVFADKSIANATTATNLANRIHDSLSNGGAARFDAATYEHALDTDIGDDIDIVPLAGGGATTYRCLGIRYDSRSSAFTFEIGRLRRFFSTTIRDLERSVDALDVHAQETDLKPTQQVSGGTTVTGTQGAGAVTLTKGVGAGAPGSAISVCSVAANAAHVDADGFMWLAIVQVDDTAGARFAGNIVWTIDLDGTDIATFTTSDIVAGKDFKARGFWPFGFTAATTFTLRGQNLDDNTGADADAPAATCAFSVTEKPKFTVNA